jgi:hypothetical protein
MRVFVRTRPVGLGLRRRPGSACWRTSQQGPVGKPPEVTLHVHTCTPNSIHIFIYMRARMRVFVRTRPVGLVPVAAARQGLLEDLAAGPGRHAPRGVYICVGPFSIARLVWACNGGQVHPHRNHNTEYRSEQTVPNETDPHNPNPARPPPVLSGHPAAHGPWLLFRWPKPKIGTMCPGVRPWAVTGRQPPPSHSSRFRPFYCFALAEIHSRDQFPVNFCRGTRSTPRV